MFGPAYLLCSLSLTFFDIVFFDSFGNKKFVLKVKTNFSLAEWAWLPLALNHDNVITKFGPNRGISVDRSVH